MIESALEFLLSAQNPDGGWGTGRDRPSHTEATSFALLVLKTLSDPSLNKRVDQGMSWLINRQGPDGSWPLASHVTEVSWSTALAVLALSVFETHRQRALRGANWLIREEGRQLGWLSLILYRFWPQKMAVQFNPDLKGWSWTRGTLSWVEPTAYALIALKKLRPFLQGTKAEERIRQGELMIYDRMCVGGGWNYGNSEVLGINLWPYPDVTALALIALQDHQQQEANQVSLRALEDMLTRVQSGLTLSWSILCFSLYGYDTNKWRNLLAQAYEKTGFLGETKSVALALLAVWPGAHSVLGM
jgi:hypothetical protein